MAGVAHEVNSPAAAIQGAVDNLAENVAAAGAARARARRNPAVARRSHSFFALVEQLAPRLAGARVEAPGAGAAAGTRATQAGPARARQTEEACRILVEIGAAEAAYQLAQLAERATKPGAAEAEVTAGIRSLALTGYLEQYAYLFRNTHAIRTAIRRITRIVGALKGYSHLDQAKVTPPTSTRASRTPWSSFMRELKYGITVTRELR